MGACGGVLGHPAPPGTCPGMGSVFMQANQTDAANAGYNSDCSPPAGNYKNQIRNSRKHTCVLCVHSACLPLALTGATFLLMQEAPGVTFF
jgi:hypothetical protein